MKLYENWWLLLKKAWSMRLMGLSALCNGALVVVAVAPDMLPKTWGVVFSIALAAVVFSLLGMWARLVKQKVVDE